MHGRVEAQAPQQALLIRKQSFLLQLHGSSAVHRVMQLVSRNRSSPSRNRTGTPRGPETRVPDILVRRRFGQNRVLPKRILVRGSPLGGATEEQKILYPPLSVPSREPQERGFSAFVVAFVVITLGHAFPCLLTSFGSLLGNRRR